ncbi:MAG: zinc-ribbon domain-containing protein [Ruminococcus sp.]
MFCHNCGKQNPDGARFCNFCGAPVRAQHIPNRQPLPNTNYRQVQPAKKSLSAGAVVAIVLASVIATFSLCIGSCTCLALIGRSSSNHDNNDPTAVEETTKSKHTEPTTAKKTQPVTEYEDTDRFLTSGVYTDSDFVFAVEVEDFDGDVYSEGTYRFYPTDVIESRNYIPTVWDIYVSDKLYSKISDLDKSSLVDTVGGLDQLETTVDLKKGQYVYIVHTEVLLLPTGILKVEKQ